MGGVSLLLIERSMPGVTTRQMKCSGVWPSGTTYITFEDVKVVSAFPVVNVLNLDSHVSLDRFQNICVSQYTNVSSTLFSCKVPVENLIGVENQGFKCIMYNFNHGMNQCVSKALEVD